MTETTGILLLLGFMGLAGVIALLALVILALAVAHHSDPERRGEAE